MIHQVLSHLHHPVLLERLSLHSEPSVAGLLGTGMYPESPEHS